MHTIPDMKGKTCKPYVEIINVRDGSVQFNGKKGFKLNTYHRHNVSLRKQSTGSFQGFSQKHKSSEDRSDSSYSQFESEWKFDQNRQTNAGRNTLAVVRASSAHKGAVANAKDRPSLFAFDNDNTDINEKPKRRSNSMGKEGESILLLLFRLIYQIDIKHEEEKTMPTTDMVKSDGSKEQENAKKFKTTLHQEEEKQKSDIKVNPNEIFHVDSERSDHQYPEYRDDDQDEKSVAISKFSSMLVPYHVDKVSLDLLPKLKLCGDILVRIWHKGTINSHLICRFSLNTSFITDNEIVLPLNQLDPPQLHDSDKFMDDF